MSGHVFMKVVVNLPNCLCRLSSFSCFPQAVAALRFLVSPSRLSLVLP